MNQALPQSSTLRHCYIEDKSWTHEFLEDIPDLKYNSGLWDYEDLQYFLCIEKNEYILETYKM